MNLRNSVFIDCTGDAIVASVYGSFLSGYVSVVAANKIACSSDYEYYLSLKNMASERGVRFMYETTVGAGLPIIKTISDLIFKRRQGYIRSRQCFPVRLTLFLMNSAQSYPLARQYGKQEKKGYSEPDPDRSERHRCCKKDPYSCP